MKKFVVYLIKVYQKWISPHKKSSCVFIPTCSEYAKNAFLKYRFAKASYLSVKRLLKCHPWQKNRIDFLK